MSREIEKKSSDDDQVVMSHMLQQQSGYLEEIMQLGSQHVTGTQEQLTRNITRLELALRGLAVDVKQLDAEQLNLPTGVEELKVLFDDYVGALTEVQTRLNMLNISVKQLNETKEQCAKWKETIRDLLVLSLQCPQLWEKINQVSPQVAAAREKLAALPQLHQELERLNQKVISFGESVRQQMSAVNDQVSLLPVKAGLAGIEARLGESESQHVQQIAQMSAQVVLDVKALQARLDSETAAVAQANTRVVSDRMVFSAWIDTHVHSHGRYQAVTVTDMSNTSGKVFWCEARGLAAATGTITAPFNK